MRKFNNEQVESGCQTQTKGKKNIRMAKVVLNRQARDIKKKYKNREGCRWLKNKQ